nr:IPT/TIG domain-containing protein [Allomuricauda sp.]
MKKITFPHIAIALTIIVGLILACEDEQNTQSIPLAVNGLSVTEGGAGLSFAITGTGFNVSPNKNTVDIGPNKALAMAANTTKLVVQLPTEGLQAGTWVVTVTTNGQTASSTQEFTVLVPDEEPEPTQAPEITLVEPMEGVPGTQVTLTGEHFGTEPSVLINNVEAADISVNESGTQLSFTVPATTTGAVSVGVETIEGTLTTSTETDFVVPLPTISAFAPNTGHPGTEVVLTVANYSLVDDYNIVEVAGPNGSRIEVEHQLNTETNEMTITLPEEVRDGTLSLTVGAQTAHTETVFDVPAWWKRADFPGAPRVGGVSTALTDDEGIQKVYIGLGYNLLDIWAYDPSTDSWEEVAPFPQVLNKWGAFSFVINNRWYIGGGYEPIVDYNLYVYNPEDDTWTVLEDAMEGYIPADDDLQFSSTFVLDNKGYIYGGRSGGAEYDFLVEFDPNNNTFSTLPPNGLDGRALAVGFSINNIGYVCNGVGNFDFFSDLQAFNPNQGMNGSWETKAMYEGNMAYGGASFVINGKAYLSTGADSMDNVLVEQWEYDPENDEWNEKTDFPGDARVFSFSASLGEHGYLGLGQFDFDVFDDFWQYTPENDNNN